MRAAVGPGPGRSGRRADRTTLLVEDLHADDVLLQLIAAPGHRLVDDEVEEALEAVDLPERRAAEESFELLALRCVLAGGVAAAAGEPESDPGSDPGLTRSDPARTGV